MNLGLLIEEILRNVPDYRKFKTVEELNESSRKLAEEYREIVELKEIGKSRDGNPILSLKIGKGRLNAVLFAFPHPNEPIGSMMLDYLSIVYAENEELRKALNFTLHIVKVSDPDGAMLNENWFKGPFTPLNYALNFYRPAGNQQVEWTFPIKYKNLNFNKPIPETKALMTLIDETKPDFIYSLHNAGFGGVYYYLSRDIPLLYPIYQYMAYKQELPLSLGEPEMPYAVKFADAVYSLPSTKDRYDYLEEHSDKDPAEIIKSGTSSVDYAKRVNPNVTELVCEVPYYYDPRIDDLSESDVIRKEAILSKLEFREELYKFLYDRFKKVQNLLTRPSKFKESIEYFLEVGLESIKAERNWAESNPELERSATVAEKFDNELVSKFYSMLITGLFLRMIEHQLEESQNKVLKDLAEEIKGKLLELNEIVEEGMNYQVIPIKKLVTVQLAAGLYTMLHIKEVSLKD